MPLPEAQLFEATLFGLCRSTDDMREGTRAFLEKRKPSSGACGRGRVRTRMAPAVEACRVSARSTRNRSDSAGCPERLLTVCAPDRRPDLAERLRSAHRHRRSRFNVASPTGCEPARAAALAAAGALDGDVEVWCVCRGRSRFPRRRGAVAETGRFDAVVCLGCLIRGATPHFEYISSAGGAGHPAASGETGVPMAFGVLTTDTWEQAEERAVEGRANKGWEAAAAAIEMAVLFRGAAAPASACRSASR